MTAALDALDGVVSRDVAEQVIEALTAAHLLRPQPWPPIPYPDDAAHQARWTMQRAFDQTMWRTGDRNEGLLAAADALLAEGWVPPTPAPPASPARAATLECGACGWEEPAQPGVVFRGCPRCTPKGITS